MNVFISHSWQDKSEADRLARDLSGVAEVWQDVRQLQPGRSIQDAIDAALGSTDLVVLVWTPRAQASDGVAAEIDTCVRLGKLVVPCLFEPDEDGRLLLPPPQLGDVLAIDFADYTLGFGRLNVVLLEMQAGEVGIDLSTTLASMNDAGAVMDYVSGYREREGVTGDRHQWATRVLDANAAVQERGKAVMERLEASVDFAQQVMTALQAEPVDVGELERLLVEARAREAEDPELMGQVRQMLETALQEAPSWGEPAAPVSAEVATSVPEAGTGGDVSDLASLVASAVGEAQAPAALAAVGDYLQRAPAVVAVLGAIALQSQSAAGAEVVAALTRYLASEHDLLPESVGEIGALDDAWLVHNTAFRLVEAGILQAGQIPVDWPTLIHADGIVLRLLPAHVVEGLAALVQQFLLRIAAEVQAYQPWMTPTGHGYEPTLAGGGSWEDQMNEALLGTGISLDF